MLPGLDGLAIVKALRAAEISVPVLILSALAHVAERVTGLRAGGDDYLSKPFAFSELHARLDALLRRPRAIAHQPPLKVADLVLAPRTRKVPRGQTERTSCEGRVGHHGSSTGVAVSLKQKQ